MCRKEVCFRGCDFLALYITQKSQLTIGYIELYFRTSIVDNARIACGAASMKQSSVCPSVPSLDSSSGVRRVCC